MAKSIGLTEEHTKQLPARHPVLRPRQIKGVAGVSGTIPLQPGEIILSEYEKKKLAKFGWKEGDPLPGNIADLMVKAKQEVADDIRTAQPFKNRPIFKAPEPIDINDLTDDKRAELQAHLAKFKELAPKIEAAARSQEHMAALPPEIQKAIRDAGGVEVVDSRGEQSDDPVKAMQRKIDEAEGRVEPGDSGTGLEDEDEQSKEKVESQTGLTSEHISCPRCNWTLAAKPNEPSQADKLNYVAGLLGDKLFEKGYSLYGGKLQINFRQLTTERSDMIFYQVAHEIRAGILGEDTYRKVMLYRMVLSIDTLALGDKEPIAIGNAVDVFMEEDNSEIKPYDMLPLVLNRLQKTEPLKNESVWRACRESFERFNTLLDDLDARADNPDFWNAIES
jgi:hypothetical protein